MDPAVSARDPRVIRAAALLREPGESICLDGPELIEAAVAEGLPIELVLAADPERWAHLPAPVISASPDALRALGALGQPATVVAIAARPTPGDPARATLVLAGVTDAGNIGSILRTAAALLDESGHDDGFRRPCVALTPDCADPMTRRALRAAAGASLRAGLIASPTNLADLPHPLVAAVPSGGDDPSNLPANAVLVLGNEKEGLTAEQLAACDARVTIPAPNFESLNVAAAAAILLWELRSTRR
jgi:TrmH family RNA methyltransferase